jgi:hypothetical protein
MINQNLKVLLLVLVKLLETHVVTCLTGVLEVPYNMYSVVVGFLSVFVPYNYYLVAVVAKNNVQTTSYTLVLLVNGINNKDCQIVAENLRQIDHSLYTTT